MTRLSTADIAGIGAALPEHDLYLQSVTGRSLAELARAAARCDRDGETTFCIVPVTSGQGVIPCFAETVRDIVFHIGFNASVSPCADAAGRLHARESGASVTLWADDARFIAELDSGERVDNTEATALGYVTGLALMTGGVSDEPVLVLGCGALGHAVTEALIPLGARVSAYDPDAARARALAGRFHVEIATSPEQALSEHDLIVDASDSPAVIHGRHVSARTHVAAPGMPRGVTRAAAERLTGRLLHDPLQIGVATMACTAHAQRMGRGTQNP